MKRNTPISRLCVLAAAAFVTASVCSAQTADWYLMQNQVGDMQWNNVSSSDAYKYWADTASLPGYTGYESRYATAMDANASYLVAAGKQIRTRGTNLAAAPTDAFLGGTLILAGSNLLHRGNATSFVTISNLTALNGATISSGVNAIQNLTITNFEIGAGTAGFASSSNVRGFNLNVSSLTGTGNLNFGAAGVYKINIANTAGFTGNMALVDTARLEFVNDLSIQGSLTINAGTTVNLASSVTASALTIGGDVLASGIYDFGYLSSTYGAIFTAGDAENGQIIVGSTIPEPAAFAVVAGLLALAATGCRRRHRASPAVVGS
ncbi:MAG: hypothetical protein ABII82_20550 [Verrucomicrobiota bacterium]